MSCRVLDKVTICYRTVWPFSLAVIPVEDRKNLAVASRQTDGPSRSKTYPFNGRRSLAAIFKTLTGPKLSGHWGWNVFLLLLLDGPLPDKYRNSRGTQNSAVLSGVF